MKNNKINSAKSLKSLLFILIMSSFFSNKSVAQMGVGTGIFIPTTGYVANVYGPLTLRGVGVTLNKRYLFKTGFTIYSMPGNAVTHLPFHAKEPLFGASTTLLIPLEIGVGARFGDVTISGTVGGFMFYNFTHRIDKGNFDRAICEYEKWDVANAELDYTNRPGFGVITGIKVEYHIKKNLSAYVSVAYLDGESVLDLNGTYKGGSLGGTIIEKTAAFNKARLSIKGSEISVGVHF